MSDRNGAGVTGVGASVDGVALTSSCDVSDGWENTA